jgi:tRNA-specific adenosine deaminase 1
MDSQTPSMNHHQPEHHPEQPTADAVAGCVLARYQALAPRHMTPGERTVLAGVVVWDGLLDCGHCVSLASGLKCLPDRAKAGTQGCVLFDAHAEVLARRGLVRWLMEQLGPALAGSTPPPSPALPDLFVVVDATAPDAPDAGLGSAPPRARLNAARYSLHLYISQAPCGDASMSVLDALQSAGQRAENEAKRSRYLGRGKQWAEVKGETEQQEQEQEQEQQKAAQLRDPAFPDTQLVERGRNNYGRLGVLRTKPGRIDSEASLSMSCSDKLARWQVLGWNGALLSLVLEPVFLASLVIGDHHDGEALRRALLQRTDTPHPLAIHPTTLPFAHSESVLLAAASAAAASTSHPHQDRCRPGGQEQEQPTCKRKGPASQDADRAVAALRNCPSGLAWCAGLPKPEILVKGLKQGHGKRAPLSTSASALCKRSMLATFLHHFSCLLNPAPAPAPSMELEPDAGSMCYHALKQAARAYQQRKERLCVGGPFAGWIRSPPDLEQFTLPLPPGP